MGANFGKILPGRHNSTGFQNYGGHKPPYPHQFSVTAAVNFY